MKTENYEYKPVQLQYRIQYLTTAFIWVLIKGTMENAKFFSLKHPDCHSLYSRPLYQADSYLLLLLTQETRN